MSNRTEEPVVMMSGELALAESKEKMAACVQRATTDTAVVETVIEPPSSWQLLNVRELCQFRELIFFLAWRDVKVRYKQTLLGAAWAVLQPALMMVVFTIFFSRMAGLSSGDVPYPLFAFAGLLPWTFFATAMTNGGNSVIGSERLITKIYFPRLAIPFASVGAAVVDFVIAFGILLLLMPFWGIWPSAKMLLMPVIFFLILLAAMGTATLLAALNVNYRDFRYVIPFLVQVGMFATPTVYMQPKGDETGIRALLMVANPMTNLISAFRATVLGGDIHWGSVSISAAMAVLIFLAGCLYFRQAEDGFADNI